jgi:DNA-binding response OmpR family regulator
MSAHAGTHIPLLMVDHDQTQCMMVATYLKPMGFEVTSVYTGTEGLERFLAEPEKWKVIILDVMLPGLDGFEVLKQIRAISHIPVIMHTARGDETDRIVGLEIGADDYLPKTFSKRELLARLRAVLRRTNAHAAVKPPPRREPAELVSGPLRLDTRSRHAEIDGVALMLTPVEFDLLASLVKASGRVKTREVLLDEIRERNYDVFDRSIDVHISSLRKKLKDHPKRPRFIRTVRSAGYMLMKSEGL